MNIHLQAISQHFLAQVRESGRDDQDQPVQRLIAKGGEPCRDVLRRALPGEAVILASFSPFTQRGPFKEFGPVFVLANASDENVRRDVLPLADGTQGRYFNRQFVLRAYDHAGAISGAELVETDTAENVLDAFLAQEKVAFVDARFPTYGCFACRIVRA